MGSCMTPFYVQTKIKQEKQPVPCGKCPACYARRVSAWSFRLMQEEKVSQSAHFITLTYDTSKVPLTQKGYMGLSKSDLQLFFKRLRRGHVSGVKSSVHPMGGGNGNAVLHRESEQERSKSIKYYAVGEYGGRTMRPHYHVILFNAELSKIQLAWQNGHVHYGDVSGASIGYCLKYMSKRSMIPMHANDDRQPEFALMSKGLGESYLSPGMVYWHKQDLDNRMYCVLKDGRKVSMARYYKDKIYSEQERKRVAYFSRANMLDKEREREEKSSSLEAMWDHDHQRYSAAFRKLHLSLKKNDLL